MPELCTGTTAYRQPIASVRVARLAEAQGGVASVEQLRECGLTASTVTRWLRSGRLHRVHPRVYAVGHPSLAIDGRLRAALLYAGDGAALSHTTAAWWQRLLTAEPDVIHVSTSLRRRSLPSVRVHRRRRLERAVHRGLPVTTLPQTLLDLAGVVRFNEVRRALAEADYRRELDVHAIEAILARGRRGSTSLRRALEHHRPELAHTLSELEERFVALCEELDVPLPEVNVRIEGMMVDALWRDQRLVVELDGHAAHGSRTAIERDRHRELRLRAAGYRVLRYTWRQVTGEGERLAIDLRRALGALPVASEPI